MRSVFVRLPRLWLLLGLATLLIAIGFGFRLVVGNVLFDLANANAVKTVLGETDNSLPLAAHEYKLANRWVPESVHADNLVLAALRATASCQLLHPEDFIDQKARLAFQGRCLWLAGDRTRALQVWRQADLGPLLMRLADNAKAHGQTQQALDEYAQALAVAPTLIKGWVALGDLYEHMERWQEAEQTYEQAILIAPDSALAHQAMAFFRWRRGWPDERTERELKTAIRLALADPQAQEGISLPWLYTELAQIYLQTGRLELAEESARNAILLTPRIDYSHLFLGEALRLQGDYNGAIIELNQALDLGSKNVWVRYSLGMAYLQAGDLAKAKQEARELSLLDPKFEGLTALETEIQRFEAAH